VRSAPSLGTMVSDLPSGAASLLCIVRPLPPPDSPPSAHNKDEEPEALKIHAPVEHTNRMFLKYSKKTRLTTLQENREALVYLGLRMCTDWLFWSFFHADWYRSMYVPKRKPAVETKWVNWEWMATRQNPTFDLIKETCDQLEMTKMMCFRYDWNKEVICQVYSTLYFDADGQRLMWMTDRKQYEITVLEFTTLLGLEH
jgi:hypothetical protein